MEQQEEGAGGGGDVGGEGLQGGGLVGRFERGQRGYVFPWGFGVGCGRGEQGVQAGLGWCEPGAVDGTESESIRIP